jgi:hypothetical protein
MAVMSCGSNIGHIHRIASVAFHDMKISAVCFIAIVSFHGFY